MKTYRVSIQDGKHGPRRSRVAERARSLWQELRHRLAPMRGKATSAQRHSWGAGKNDEPLTFRIPVAGWSPENIKVWRDGSRLVVVGERENARTLTKRDARMYLRRQDRFLRVFPLPEGYRGDQVDATLRNGELTLSIASDGDRSLRTIPRLPRAGGGSF